MAIYNLIRSTVASDFVNGTEGNDSISVYGNFSTVQANGGDDIISVNGGRHDNGMWVEGDEGNLIYAGNGNDSISVHSRGVSVYGGNGNDTVNFASSCVYADGGSGDDIFYRYSYNPISENVTMTTGVGADTLYFDHAGYTRQFKAVVTDFSNDDAIYLDQNYYRSWGYGSGDCGAFSYTIENGNVVISDNASISGDNVVVNAINPRFTVTLKGVGSIGEVANAKFYRYYGSTPLEITTLGELFGVEPIETTPTVEPEPTVPTYGGNDTPTTSGGGSNDTPKSSSNNGGGNIYIFGNVYVINDNNGTVLIDSTVSGGVTNHTNVDNSTSYTYSGGYDTIGYNDTSSVTGNYTDYAETSTVNSSYGKYEQVNLSTEVQGFAIKDDNFYVTSKTGALRIQDARGKNISYGDNKGNQIANSYLASGAGSIDKRSSSKIEVLVGANNADNAIYAGSAGSTLWGGAGGSDTLTGGEGFDEFIYTAGSGNDVIQNAAGNDVVNLAGVKMSQIVTAKVGYNEISATFQDGGSLKIQGYSNVGFKVDGVVYAANRSTGSWYTK